MKWREPRCTIIVLTLPEVSQMSIIDTGRGDRVAAGRVFLTGTFHDIRSIRVFGARYLSLHFLSRQIYVTY